MSGAHWLLAVLIANPIILGAVPGVPERADAPPVSGMNSISAAADRDKRLTIPVMIEGAGPYRFMIDTGSQATVVSRDLAARLALAAGPTVTVVGVADRGPVATAKVRHLAFGQQQVTDLTAPLLEQGHIGADGILGTDSLGGQRVLFDFTRNMIAVGEAALEPRSSEYEIVVRARSKMGRLIITDAEIDGVHTRVIIDTGASGTIGNRSLQRQLGNRLPTQNLSVTSVTGASLPVDYAMAGKLRIDTLSLRNVPVAFADAPAFVELGLDKRPAILLGIAELRAFKRVAIDFAQRKVLFDLPDSN